MKLTTRPLLIVINSLDLARWQHTATRPAWDAFQWLKSWLLLSRQNPAHN